MLLVNPTLVNKVRWAQQAPHSVSRFDRSKTWSQAAKDDLMAYLCRKGWIDTEATAKGKEYEDIINTEATKLVSVPGGQVRTDLDPLEQKTMEAILKAVADNRQQVFKVGDIEDVELSTEGIKLYGYLDYLLDEAHLIQDLKTTSSYKPEKYDSSMQDVTYRYLLHKETGVPYAFRYLVGVIGEGYKYPTALITRNHPALPMPALYAVLKSYISDTLAYLKATGLWECYRQCYCHKGQGFKGDMKPDEVNALYKDWQERMGV